MELNSYQRKSLRELSAYLDLLNRTGSISKAYREHWLNLGLPSDAMPPYQDTIRGVPHICLKVPTGGGKTFLACASVKVIVDALPLAKPKAVVWLVPSNAILEQTIRNLSDPAHPYRQRLERDFRGRVEVYTKEQLLAAQNFSPPIVREQLSVCIFSYDSIRSNKKEGRLVYRQNSGLAEFAKEFPSPETLIDGVDETALIQTLNRLSPIVVVDESHNAQSCLSVEMLRNLNPSLVLDLTATPRDKSNLVSIVDALELKKASMVKLPVIVYNRYGKNDVVRDAIQLRGQIEAQAKAHRESGGKRIRPIVLFQAEPKNNDDAATFQKIKETLIRIGIAPEEIAIKTSEINEIKNIDLLGETCKIRYIITVNALKEGWDCPFAYILATLANKSSPVDVEQIVGRILRLPYAQKYEQQLLNRSFVLTCSNDFMRTLSSVVAGLNNAGFSKMDMRVAQFEEQAPPSNFSHTQLTFDDITKTDENEEDIDAESIGRQLSGNVSECGQAASNVNEMIQQAEEQSEAYELEAEAAGNDGLLSGELGARMNRFPLREEYEPVVKNLLLPQFFLKINADSLLLKAENVLLDKAALSHGFSLQKKDTEINFNLSGGDIYAVDVSRSGDSPKYQKVSEADSKYIRELIASKPADKQKKMWAEHLADRLDQARQMEVVNSRDLQEYVLRIVNEMDADAFAALGNALPLYARKIQDKIENLLDKHREDLFRKMLDTGDIVCSPAYKFPAFISPTETGGALEKSLYDSEGAMNAFEHSVIASVAALDNVSWWHRVTERKNYSFHINGFINHYPDFIVMTKSGNLLIIETKGDDRDNSDSVQKLNLGRTWMNKAGERFRYFMVFQNKDLRIDGAYQMDEFIGLVKKI
ncbi:MAG: DEAD/DEAH box helicase family protein [Deltaproteobacteria bacterium]|nr:DEAD/DEAH box helicase family protein [Deltaproteobacteria bacterium]